MSLQQIGARLGPVINQVMQRRGANLVVEAGATLSPLQATRCHQ